MSETESSINQNLMLSQAESLLQASIQVSQKKDFSSIYQAIRIFETECINAGYTSSEIDDARYFICTFIDEENILEKSLLSTFYDSKNNGNAEFLDRLERRQKDPQKNIDILELAYVCLSLNSNKNLAQVTDSLYSSIRDVRNDLPYCLDIKKPEKEEHHWHCPPIWVTVLLALVILFTLFIPYNNQLNQYTVPVINAIDNVISENNGQ